MPCETGRSKEGERGSTTDDGRSGPISVPSPSGGAAAAAVARDKTAADDGESSTIGRTAPG